MRMSLPFNIVREKPRKLMSHSQRQHDAFAPRRVKPESEFLNLLGSPWIDSQHGGAIKQPFMTYRPARLCIHRLAESIPWNRFLGSLRVYKFWLWSGLQAFRKANYSVFKICSKTTCSVSLHVWLKVPSHQIRLGWKRYGWIGLGGYKVRRW